MNCLPPRISIIVATFNAARTLERCLASVFSQTFVDWELLVMDGLSTDGTAEMIQNHDGRIAFWQSVRDAGIYDAWNQALARARGEYVAFLGADDAWSSPHSLQTVFDLVGHQHVDLVTARGRLVDARGNFLEDFGKPWNYRAVMRRMVICHPGTLHRRDLFQRFGAFDTTYRISADYDFLLRLPPDLRTLHVPVPIIDVSDGGISRDRRWLMLNERFRAQAGCPRVGRTRAALNYVDKLWRIPAARMLGMRN